MACMRSAWSRVNLTGLVRYLDVRLPQYNQLKRHTKRAALEITSANFVCIRNKKMLICYQKTLVVGTVKNTRRSLTEKKSVPNPNVGKRRPARVRAGKFLTGDS